MSQSFWESEVESEAQPEQPAAQPEQVAEQPAQLAAEPVQTAAESEQPEQPLAEPERPVAQPAESGALALSVDDFSALEERILRAVNLVKRERLARAAAEERAAAAEHQLREQAPLVENLQKEVSTLRAERDHVRQRVERLLAQLDALEL
jgi:mannose-6-phosphate isomerase class I